MKKILDFEKLEPRGVLKWFKKICSIPHGSYNEGKLSDTLKQELLKAGCTVKQFSSKAIAIKKTATKGYEKKPIVLLQAHMDMVCVHRPELKIDMAKTPVKPFYDPEDGCIKCDGTTLGADNGIGVATIMEIMTNDKYKHGLLEALLSVCEEVDVDYCMSSIPNKFFKAKYLINLDHDTNNTVCVSCNGTSRIECSKKLNYKPATKGTKTYLVKLWGFAGGHSALLVHYPIANAIKLMNEILYSFSQDKAKISLISLNGGNAMNALPSNVEALIQMNPKDVPEFKKHCKKFVESSIKLAQGLDDKAKFSIQLASKQEKKACSIEESEKLFLFYAFVPTGIFRMDICLKHIFSSGNIGKVRTEKGVLSNQFCSRSFYLPELEKQYKDICYLGKLVGMGNFYREITIPSWLTYEPENVPVVSTWVKCYKKKTKVNPELMKTAGSLEAAVLIAKNPQLDHNSMAVGPRILDEHGITEKVYVSTIKTFFEVLLDVLKEIK